MRTARIRTAAAAVLLALLVAGCRSSGGMIDPDTLFGHRYEGRTPDGREVIDLSPPPEEELFLMPAFVTEVDIRQGELDADGRRAIDLRIEGSLPDMCTQPHDLSHDRLGNLITVSFDIRRAKGAVCPQVVRHYVVYHELEERLHPGSYTLRLNDSVHPFQVFPDIDEQ